MSLDEAPIKREPYAVNFQGTLPGPKNRIMLKRIIVTE
jgi:hypothetical protein